MSSDFVVGRPAYSSTPKLKEGNQNVPKRQPRAMSSQVEVKHLNVSDGGKSIQKTTVEKSYTSAGGSRSFSNEAKVYPSSYQLRFGGRSRGFGYGRSGVEATITRVTVNDGLELTPNLISSRAEEKAALGSLNDRFVTYIEKVRALVNCNQILEAKVKQLEASQAAPSRSGDMYDEHLHKLQRELEMAISDKTQVELELEGCYRELDTIRKQLEREIEDRKEAENESKSLCKDVDQATLVRVELEGKVESLREELDLVRKTKDEDIRELTERLLALRSGDVVLDGSHPTDLSEALRDIRSAYEQLTQNNKGEIEGYYKAKIAELSDQLRDENNSNKNGRAELMETRRQLQSVTVEVEGLRTSNASLESHLEEMEIRYQSDIANYQNSINELELELNASRDKVQRQLIDYNDLLHLKLSLDLEIQTYRKLLEGEESRINVSGLSAVSSADKIQVNVVERVVTDDSSSSSSSDSESSIDNEAIDMLKAVVEAKLDIGIDEERQRSLGGDLLPSSVQNHHHESHF